MRILILEFEKVVFDFVAEVELCYILGLNVRFLLTTGTLDHCGRLTLLRFTVNYVAS